MQCYGTDVLIIGSGVAGLAVALDMDARIHVTVLTKAHVQQSNSYRAQGGIAAAVGVGDSPTLHKEDTLRTGVQMCNPCSVDVLVNSASDAIRRLSRAGVPFDRNDKGWLLGMEGSHSVARILHAFGDATGAAMTQTLLRRVVGRENFFLHTHVFAFDLWVSKGRCQGVWAITRDRRLVLYRARLGVVLATGGCGQVYGRTTNDPVSTGDGFALAYRAGVPLLDMEFVQFHPTALDIRQNPMPLISEAVRGEGAQIVDETGEPLLAHLHSRGDLAPRDVVARAIHLAQSQGRRIFLDARCLRADFTQRFPHIDRACRQRGIDPATEMLPITPAAHFIMGGVEVDLGGATPLPNLYACGEVACTGAHGANRLASNSLLEGVVFAQRVAKRLQGTTVVDHGGVPPTRGVPPLSESQVVAVFKDRLQTLMWDHVGIMRTSEGLQLAHQQLQLWGDSLPSGCFVCRNLWIAAQAIVRAALWREESRGGHYRVDYSQTLPQWSTRHYRVVCYAQQG
ncbi:L-aspartate oxidase [Pasteuria penetrans]|uniref:L-aspartate oxidase n=1 Tax=Pasteuria penetrans TaxID=86005 RepID=UPI000FA94812|nr:L-aspartate oxidase [Pasteuria penetrans]